MMINPRWILVAGLVAGGFASPPARGAAATAHPPLAKRDVLSVRDGRFYLHDQPFAEISFNKFDLLWQLYGQLARGQPLHADNPLVQAQDKALRELREMGFRSIRIFALPWGPAGPESYADPARRKLLFAAHDKVLELCDRHDIRVVWSLGAVQFTDPKRRTGQVAVAGEEHERELIANPASRGRTLLYRYIDETVARYRHHQAVLMWEISNEPTLLADIGDKDRIHEGRRMPTLKEVAGFLDAVAQRIKAADPLRLVNSGGSHLRESQWNLSQKKSWKPDTFEEQCRCFELLYAHSAVDVIDVHSYMNNKPGYVISDGQGGEAYLDFRGWMTIAGRIGKPLMIGELGLHAVPKTDQKVWKKTPDYFASYADTAAAKPWVEQNLNEVIAAGVPLSYWWCYQSDRPMDQNNPQRFDLTRERNPELVACIVAANQRLQQQLGIPAPAAKGAKP